MAHVDLSRYTTNHRVQGAECWGYASLACWDVFNEIVAPNAPNLSMSRYLRLFALGDQWRASGVVVVPDGRFPSMRKANGIPVPGPEWGDPPFFNTFGNTTEGTEPHVADLRLIGNFTREGTNEARNYRLAREPTWIAVSKASLWPSSIRSTRSGTRHVLPPDRVTSRPSWATTMRPSCSRCWTARGTRAYGTDGACHFLALPMPTPSRCRAGVGPAQRSDPDRPA